jgi:leucyl-tRNA synthetase
MLAADASRELMKEQALACDQIQQWVEGKEIKKVIVVPGKLVSVVVK